MSSSHLDSGYLRHFEACNRHDLSHFAPFFVESRRYGWVKRDIAALLAKNVAAFERQGNGIALASDVRGFTARTEALMEATLVLVKHFGKPLRNEFYPLVENWGDTALAQIDRVAVPWFGIRAWGLHVNGFVRKPDGLYLWVGERAPDRQVEPGKLDNIIGGGIPIGLSLDENLCKEAKEEAGMVASVARTAKLIRSVNYTLELPDGLRADTLFVYDVDLPETFRPQNTDDEVAAFHLLPLAEVDELIRTTDRFKFNCPLIIIDFLMRHGHIMSSAPGYDELQSWLK